MFIKNTKIWSIIFSTAVAYFLHRIHNQSTPKEIWPPPNEPPGTSIIITNTTHTNPVFLGKSEGDGDASILVKEALNNWIESWKRRDVVTYLNFYATDFSPSNKLSRQAWEDSRKKTITSKKHIDIHIEELNIYVNENIAVTSFKQIYKDNTMQSIDRKTLKWVFSNMKWQIIREENAINAPR